MSKITVMALSTNFTVKQALDSADNYELTDVIVLGYEDNDLVVISSKMTRAEANWMLDKAKLHAMEGEA